MNERAALSERGQAIWDAYGASQLPAGHRALVHEAARIADTLDRLALLAAGDVDTWAKIALPDGGDITLEISGAVAEMRNQQTVLKNVMLEIRQIGLVQQKPKAKDEEREANDDPSAVILKFQQRADARSAG